jgi:type I restriction enzyme S subunit
MNIAGNEREMFNENNSITEEARRELGAFLFPKGSTIFPKIGGAIATNKKRLTTRPCCVDNNVMGVIPRDGKIDGQFLFYFFVKHDLSEFANEAHLPSIKKTIVENWPIALPASLAEQRRIVAILDEAFEAIATAKANTENILQNARCIFNDFLRDVFSRRGDGWVDRTLDDVCKVERGSSPRPIKSYFTTSADGVNWIKIGDTEEGGKYVFSTAQKITQEGAKQSRYVKEGDFILTNSMSFGRPYIMRTTGYIHDGWFVLRLRDVVDTDYFYYLLSSDFVQQQFSSLAAGAVVKNISGDLVKRAVLAIPPLVEQKVLVEKFVALEEATESLAAICQKKLATLEELKTSLLHHAFTGQLTGNKAEEQVEAVA